MKKRKFILLAEKTGDIIAIGRWILMHQEDFLMEHGCFLIQGFLYARPMPLDKLNNFLKAYE
jgi:EAL domain-containing protein (putative c-di-GMP-specific phosphodiesterase class I)